MISPSVFITTSEKEKEISANAYLFLVGINMLTKDMNSINRITRKTALWTIADITAIASSLIFSIFVEVLRYYQ